MKKNIRKTLLTILMTACLLCTAVMNGFPLTGFKRGGENPSAAAAGGAEPVYYAEEGLLYWPINGGAEYEVYAVPHERWLPAGEVEFVEVELIDDETGKLVLDDESGDPVLVPAQDEDGNYIIKSPQAVEIPDEVNGYPVTAIADYAFSVRFNEKYLENVYEDVYDESGDVLFVDSTEYFGGCGNLSSVNIPEGIKYIGERAFFDCWFLKKVNYDAVSCEAGENYSGGPFSAGYNNDYTFGSPNNIVSPNITIGAGVKIIPYSMFAGATLNKLTFEENSVLERIEDRAFEGCNIQYVYGVPDGLYDIGGWNDYLFNVSDGWEYLDGEDEKNYSYRVEYFGNVVITFDFHYNQAGENDLFLREGTTGIVENVSGRSVNIYGYGVDFETVYIPASVKAIGDQAFRECYNLRDVQFENAGTLEKVGKDAFSSPYNDGNFDIENAIPWMEELYRAVDADGYKEGEFIYYCPNGEGDYTDAICFGYLPYMDWYNYPDENKEPKFRKELAIAEGTRILCGKPVSRYTEKLTLPESLVYIAKGAFFSDWPEHNLREVNIPENVKIIEENQFRARWGEGNPESDYPDLIVTVEGLPEKICSGAFTGAKAVIFKGETAPYLCERDSVCLISWEYDWENNEEYTFTTTMLLVPEGSYADYVRATYNYTGRQSYEDAIYGSVCVDGIYISDNVVILYTGGAQKITIPEGVEKIADYAFDGSDITGAVISKTVRYIGSFAFRDCRNLMTLTFETDETGFSELREIGFGAFIYCAGLRTVEFPKGLQIIGGGSFLECESLRHIDLPASLTEIRPAAFFDTPFLKDVAIPDCGVRLWWPRNVSWIENGYPFWPELPFNENVRLEFKGNILDYWDEVEFEGYWDDTGELGEFWVDPFIDSCPKISRDIWEYMICVIVPDDAYGNYKEFFTYDWYNYYEELITATPYNLFKAEDVEKFIIDFENEYYDEGKGGWFTAPKLIGYRGADTVVNIPDNVAVIGEYAFSWREHIASVTIPESVINIGYNAFYGLENLERLNVLCTDVWMNAYYDDWSGSYSSPFGGGMGSLSGGVTIYTKVLDDGLFPPDANIKHLILETGGCPIYWEGDELFCDYIFIDDYFTKRVYDYDTDEKDLKIYPPSIIEFADDGFYVLNSDVIDLSETEWFIVPTARYDEYIESEYWEWLGDKIISWRKYYADDDGFVIKDGVVEKFVGDLDGDGNVNIPGGVKRFARNAFGETGVKSVTFGADFGEGLSDEELDGLIESLHEGFDGCDELTKFNVDPDNPYFVSIDGVLFAKGKQQPQPPQFQIRTFVPISPASGDLPEIEDGILLLFPQDWDGGTSYTIPTGVIAVAANAFNGCYLQNLDADFEHIIFYPGAFNGFYLDGLDPYSGVLYYKGLAVGIGGGAYPADPTKQTVRAGTRGVAGGTFMNLYALETVTLPDGLMYIGVSAFDGCAALDDITLPDTLVSIGKGAFEGTKYYSGAAMANERAVYAGNWLVGILEQEGEPDNAITIKAGTVGIADGAFALADPDDTAELYVDGGLPSSLRIIGKEAFKGTKDWESSADGIVSVGGWAVGVKGYPFPLAMPNGVVGIANNCFENFPYLTEFLPASVTHIGRDALKGHGVFDKTESGIVYFGAAAIGFKGEAVMGDKPVKLVLGRETTIIAAAAFADCEADYRCVELGSNIKSAGPAAFLSARAAVSLYALPDKVESLIGAFMPAAPVFVDPLDISGYRAAVNAHKFSGITFADSRQLTDDLFHFVNGDVLKYYGTDSAVYIPYATDYIIDNAFSDCGFIKVIFLPSSGKVNLDGSLGDLDTDFKLIVSNTSQYNTYTSAATAPDWSDYVSPVNRFVRDTGEYMPTLYGVRNRELSKESLTLTYEYTLKAVYTRDGGPENEFASGTLLTADGVYTVTLTGYFGTPVVYTFTIDRTLPNLTALDGTPSDDPENPTVSRGFTGTASDANFDKAVVYKLYGSDYIALRTITDQGNNNVGINAGIYLSDGEGVYKIAVTDKAGNESVFYVVIDLTAPVLDLNSSVPSVPSLSTDSTAPTVLNSFTATARDDNHDNFKGTVITRLSDGVETVINTKALDYSFADGAYKIEVWDKAGNSSAYYVTIDNTAPVLPSLEGLTGTPVVQSFSGTVDDANYKETAVYSGGVKIHTFTTTAITINKTFAGGIFTDGKYGIEAWDLAGNVTTYYIIIDNTAPELDGSVSLSADVTAPTLLKTFTGAANDANYDRTELTRMSDNYRIVIDKTFTLDAAFADGAYRLDIFDKAGNSATYYVTLVNSPPQLRSLEASSEETPLLFPYFSDTVVNAAYYDRTIIYRLSGDGYSEYKPPIVGNNITLTSSDPDATYKIEVWDRAGNFSVYYLALYGARPELIIDGALGEQPSQSAYNPTMAQSFAGSVNSEYFDRIEISKKSDNYSSAEIIRDANVVIAAPDYADDTYKIEVWSRAGIVSVYFVLIDTVQPTVSVAEGGVYLSPVLTYSVGASGLRSAVLDGPAPVVDFPVISGTTTLNRVSFPYPDGEYNLTVTNNAGSVTRVAFTLKNTPVLGYIKDGGEFVELDAESYIVSGAATLTYRVSNCTNAAVTLNGETRTWNETADFTVSAAAGRYVFTVRGDAGVMKTFEVNITKNKPEILLSVKLADEDVTKRNVTIVGITGNVDDETGIEITLNGERIDYEKGMTLRDDGRYVIKVTDRAGETAETIFYIEKALNGGYIAAGAAAPAAGAGALLWLGRRKRLKL